MRITYEKLNELKNSLIRDGLTDLTDGMTRLEIRNRIFNTFDENDFVLTEDKPAVKLALGLSLATYDREGKGYKGIKLEILERRDSLKRLQVKSWFKHSSNVADCHYNNRKAEKKTGCGAWFNSHGTLQDARKELEDSGNYILWDYDHEPAEGAKNDNPIHIHIACTWRQFFRYLDTYSGGWKTFFKLNKNKSVMAQTNIYEMQTLKTSRKKIAFLENFEI